MNERIKELSEQADLYARSDNSSTFFYIWKKRYTEKFVELIVKEMCGMMEQAEDDCYHCFEPSERPTEYISWLNEWRTRFEQHFGVEE
jgi:hypothetical protein